MLPNRFIRRERIIEWKVKQSDPPRPLLDVTVTKFVEAVRGRNPAPGGGSVAALVGALVSHPSGSGCSLVVRRFLEYS